MDAAGGYIAVMLRDLQQHLHFTSHITITDGWGTEVNNTWNGMVGFLTRRVSVCVCVIYCTCLSYSFFFMYVGYLSLLAFLSFIQFLKDLLCVCVLIILFLLFVYQSFHYY